MEKDKINLVSITKAGLEANLKFESGFHTKSGIYVPGGVISIRILNNNLNGGYVGNTLLRKTEKSEFEELSNTDLRIGDYLFSRCQLKLFFNGDYYCFRSKYNYLRMNAKILDDL